MKRTKAKTTYKKPKLADLYYITPEAVELINKYAEEKVIDFDGEEIPKYNPNEIARILERDHNIKVDPSDVWWFRGRSYKDGIKEMTGVGKETKKDLLENFLSNLILFFEKNEKKETTLKELQKYFANEWWYAFRLDELKGLVVSAANEYPNIIEIDSGKIKYDPKYRENLEYLSKHPELIEILASVDPGHLEWHPELIKILASVKPEYLKWHPELTKYLNQHNNNNNLEDHLY
ncbi:MAG: hypothetical protein ACP5JY_00695 [Candidatus Nanoarchaeia archaeon]